MKRSGDKSFKRWQQSNYLADEVMPNIPPTWWKVLSYGFRHGRGFGYFEVATTSIAMGTGLSRRTVQSSLDGLQEQGILAIERAPLGKRNTKYRIQFKLENDTVSIPTFKAAKANSAKLEAQTLRPKKVLEAQTTTRRGANGDT